MLLLSLLNCASVTLQLVPLSAISFENGAVPMGGKGAEIHMKKQGHEGIATLSL